MRAIGSNDIRRGRGTAGTSRIARVPRWAAVAAVAVGLAGCADDGFVGPPPPDVAFSAEAVANSIYSLRFAADNVAVVQVGTITDALGLTTPGFSAVPRRYERGEVTRDAIPSSFVPSVIRRLFADRAVRASAGASAVPLFPLNFLGKTFVYDSTIDAYVIDNGLGGAPGNGVRFILYRLETDSRLPALPLAPFGYLDLIDQSDAVSTRLRIRAFDEIGDVPLSDYVVDGAFGSVSTGLIVNFLSDGFIADHNGRFDFELDQTYEFDDVAGVTLYSVLHRVISDEGSNVEMTVEGGIPYEGPGSDLEFTFDIRGSAGTTLVDLRIVDGVQTGVIAHGGRDEVYVSGSVQLPDYVRARGGAFTPSEVAALDEILFGIDDVLIMADELFRPLGELFGVR